jgi:purine catabolism regulator
MEQVAYLQRLAAAAAAGLVIVADSAPPISREMVEAADHLDFPLIRTVLKQPFEAISKVVFTANTSSEAEKMVRHLRMYGVLRKIATRGATPSEILQALSRLTGMRLSVHRWDGRPQFEPGPVHPRWEEAITAVTRLGHGARSGLYARLPGHDGEPDAYIIQLDVAPVSQVFLLANGLSPSAVPDLVALHHGATIAATQVMALNGERAIRQRLSAELLEDVLEHGGQGEGVHARLEALGLASERLVGLAVECEDRNRMTDVLHNGLLDRDLPSLVGNHRHHLMVVAPVGASPPESESVAQIVAALIRGSSEAPFAVGAGTVGPIENAPVSCSEAVVASGYASRTGQTIVHFGRLDWPLAWLPSDLDHLHVLVDRTLGPLLAHDSKHGTSLVTSVSEFLRNEGRPGAAAKVLRIHRNTLAYRLRKVEQLTGLSLDSVQGKAQLWLGLQAHDLTGNLPSRAVGGRKTGGLPRGRPGAA